MPKRVRRRASRCSDAAKAATFAPMTRADPAPPVHVAPLASTQVDAAWALTRELSWPHRREDWELMLALGAGIGAVSDGRLVGTTLWWPYGPSAATLGLVIVDAPWRGRGLGAG
jgi:hypothetical protein